MFYALCNTSLAADMLGPSACESCHDDEYRTWEKTKHAKSEYFYEREDSQKMAQAMQLTDLDETRNVCWSCHYTVLTSDGETLPETGPACESCHAPASQWLAVHDCYGGDSAAACVQLNASDTDIKRTQETPAHKQWRYTERVKLGMLPANQIYNMATKCFQCHTISAERLVNVGQHSADKPFELVAWSQGELRHHFLRSSNNPPRSIEYQRVQYVIGQMVDLEYSLRALAKATSVGAFSQAMQQRIQAAASKLKAIQQRHNEAIITQVIQAYTHANLAPNQHTALLKVAEFISTQAQNFEREYAGKGARLVKLTDLLPTKMKANKPN